jgi:hypothetical protein
MPNTPEAFPVYTKLDQRQFAVLLARIKVYMKDFSENNAINDIITTEDVLIEICDRIEKRRIYFHIFYNCKMGELNEGALMCFWIVKLTPFVHTKIPAYELNAKIALYLFNNMLIYYAKKNNKKVNITEQIQERIYYGLRYRDISKEALMTLAESLIY